MDSTTKDAKGHEGIGEERAEGKFGKGAVVPEMRWGLRWSEWVAGWAVFRWRS